MMKEVEQGDIIELVNGKRALICHKSSDVFIGYVGGEDFNIFVWNSAGTYQGMRREFDYVHKIGNINLTFDVLVHKDKDLLTGQFNKKLDAAIETWAPKYNHYNYCIKGTDNLEYALINVTVWALTEFMGLSALGLITQIHNKYSVVGATFPSPIGKCVLAKEY